MIDFHPPWAALLAYAFVAALCLAAGWLWRSRREARHRQQAAATELAHAAARYAAVIDAASDAVISIDEEQRIVLFNAAAQRMFGCTAAEVIGTGIERFVPPEAREQHRELVREYARRDTLPRPMSLQRRLQALRADGSRFDIEASLSQAEEPGTMGRRRLYTVLVRDVSQARRAEEALRESESRYRAIFDQAVVGIAQMNLDGRFVGANARLCEMLGYSFDELAQLRMHDLTHGEDLSDHQPQFDALIRGGPPFTIEKRCLRKDGRLIWVEAAFNAIRGAKQTVSSIVTTSINIDSRKLATAALERSREELRRLSASLTQAREDERRHLARELHDELGQCLSAIKMELASLSRVVVGDAGLEQRLAKLLETVDDTIVSARRIAADLRPSMLDDLGLNATLEWLVKDWSLRSGLVIGLEADAVDEILNDAAATAIYRIVQEALTNVGRHAHATRAEITLRCEGTELCLGIEDDGDGLAPGAADKQGSHGLLGVRERARVLGGTVQLANVAEGGFRLEVRLPLSRIDSRPGQLLDAHP